jgi:hypothetical protein
MNTWRMLFAMLQADWRERTRRYSFLVTICLVIYLGYAVNAGQILIHLDKYRGVYNSAWVGSLMTLVITFFLGLFGFYLVKNAIDRDERTGVGQIIATTSLTRAQYMVGKWLSNFAVLATAVVILAAAALLMQLVQREDAQLHVWALLAPFLFIALPMMAFVAAVALFFEAISWLRGGFGNMVYFGFFIFLFAVAVRLSGAPWLDVTGISLIGPSMKAAAKAAYPDYNGTFVLTMATRQQLATFVWSGLAWTVGLVVQRLLWVVVALAVALVGSLLFNRFDSSSRRPVRGRRNVEPAGIPMPVEADDSHAGNLGAAHLTPLAPTRRFHANFLRLTWLEGLLLVKGLKWYWLAGMTVMWLGCAASPSEGMRKYWFMLAGLWPVLVWSKMGEREARYQTGQLIFQAAHPLLRLLVPAWVAGVVCTAVVTSGVLLGRLTHAESLALLPWLLSVLFIPTLALALGTWSHSSKLFEVVYPILWYLGPFNTQNSLAMLDYLGVHAGAWVNVAPLLATSVILCLLLLSVVGRSRELTV